MGQLLLGCPLPRTDRPGLCRAWFLLFSHQLAVEIPAFFFLYAKHPAFPSKVALFLGFVLLVEHGTLLTLPSVVIFDSKDFNSFDTDQPIP